MEFLFQRESREACKLVLSIPEGVVERRTAVHPVCAFTSIRRDCVGCSSVRGRVIVSVVRRVDSLAVHCLFTRSRSDNLSRSQILREDRDTTIRHTCSLDVCPSLLDPKLTFWCMSNYLGASGTVWLLYKTRCKTGRTSAKVRATKSRRIFSQRMHAIHPNGPKLMFWYVLYYLGAFGAD